MSLWLHLVYFHFERRSWPDCSHSDDNADQGDDLDEQGDDDDFGA
jgi:hypothetical protein